MRRSDSIGNIVQRGMTVGAALRVAAEVAPPEHQAAWRRELDSISATLEVLADAGLTLRPGPMWHPDPAGGGERGLDRDPHVVNRPRPVVHGPRNPG